jgi:rubrerythrin
MPSKQIRDILDYVRKFHCCLHDFYEACGEETEDERVKALLDYMGRHEGNFNKALARYEETAAQGVLDTWLQFAPDETLNQAFKKVELTPGMSPDEVIQVALDLDKTLLTLYEELAQSTSAPHVKELFMNLLQMEEGKDHQYARSLFDV